MGQKNSKGSVSLTNANDRIRLRWTSQGMRYSLNLFQYKKENILKAKNIALQIENDIVAGTFDTTLRNYNHNQPPEKQTTALGKNLLDLFEEWTTDYRKKNIRSNKRIKNYVQKPIITNLTPFNVQLHFSCYSCLHLDDITIT